MDDQLKTGNKQPKLKVCGLTKLDQIQELIAFGTDFLGFIFYEKSPRYVLNHLTLQQISDLDHEGKTGVFVNENLEQIVQISERAELKYVQLHGDETQIFIRELRQELNPNIKIINVIRIGEQTLQDIQKILDAQTADLLLFDTDSKAFGGTGKTFDWVILNDVEFTKPYFLSGGIAEENIDKLSLIIQKPFALDINSKFEIEAGNKDIDKIKKFKNILQL